MMRETGKGRREYGETGWSGRRHKRDCSLIRLIRLRRRLRVCPWMNAQKILVLRRDVALDLRRITASWPNVKTGALMGHGFTRRAPF
jgi:hypothetical protein